MKSRFEELMGTDAFRKMNEYQLNIAELATKAAFDKAGIENPTEQEQKDVRSRVLMSWNGEAKQDERGNWEFTARFITPTLEPKAS